MLYYILLIFLLFGIESACAQSDVRLLELERFFSTTVLDGYSPKDDFFQPPTKAAFDCLKAQCDGIARNKEKLVEFYAKLFPALAARSFIDRFFDAVICLNERNAAPGNQRKSYLKTCSLRCWHISRRLYALFMLYERCLLQGGLATPVVHVSFAENGLLWAAWLAEGFKLLSAHDLTLVVINPSSCSEADYKSRLMRFSDLVGPRVMLQAFAYTELYLSAVAMDRSLAATSIDSVDAVGFGDFDDYLFDAQIVTSGVVSGVYKLYASTTPLLSKLIKNPSYCNRAVLRPCLRTLSVYDLSSDSVSNKWGVFFDTGSALYQLNEQEVAQILFQEPSNLVIRGRRPHPDFISLIRRGVVNAHVPIVVSAGRMACVLTPDVSPSDLVNLKAQL